MSQTNQYCKCDLKYQQLSVIDVKQLQQIKLVFIFGNQQSNENIFITNIDEVYGFGTNLNGRLGLGHSSAVKEQMIIKELCGKSIRSIESGLSFMAAITEFGEIYVWGKQVNNGYSSYCKPQKINFDNHLMSDIKCCSDKTILLTQTAQIYWFYSSIKQDVHVPGCASHTAYITVSITSLSNQEMTAISCGLNHCLTSTITGKVYAWGLNSSGQLGLGHNNLANEPQLIQLADTIFIKGMSCGSNHSLLLTTEGHIYSFGDNKCGQLGAGDTSNRNIPTFVTIPENCVEMLAFENISMVLSETKHIYVWGEVKLRTIDSPFKTEFKSFQSAIDFFSKHIFTFKPLSLNEIIVKKAVNRVMETMAKAFNNSKNCDLKFKIKRKGSEEFDYIYGHKWFIEENSEYFQRMFANNWSESKTNEIQINGYSYESYYLFIRYLYTDYIETEDIEELVEMLSISDEYIDEKMKTKCVERVKPLINVVNVCSLYSSALTNRSKELEDFCFKFMSAHIKHITDTEDYQKMEGNVAKHFLTKYSKLESIQ